MAEDFNPYHVWLGIPPDEQPANHYRLLSLRLFETSADVIDSAADRQMAHLRTFQSGKHGELTQRLLNEVAAARVCLLDPKKRAAYDQQLRAKLPATPAAGQSAASGSAIQRQPPRRPGPLQTVAPAPAPNIPVAAALPQPANDWDDLLGDPAAKPASRSAGKSAGANAVKAAAAKRAANNRNMSIGIAAAVLLIAAAGIGWFALNGSSSEGTLVFDWPSDEMADATVTVDDVPLPAPASGAWEYHGPAGSHHIVALRPAYKLDANVVLAAGQRQTAPADWKPKATLVLNWPPSQRAGAELRIDGRTHAVTQHDPLEIAVEPGPHVVQITRPNSAPIVHSVTVASEGRVQVAIAPPLPSATKLVFDWPADQRKDAELIIDGSKQTVPSGSDSATFALVVAPGRRVVHITRTGFEPFNTEIDLVAGANEVVKPSWTPVQTVASDTAAPAPPPVETPAKKLPIPPVAEQEKVAKQLDDLYKSSHSGSKDPAKAQELYDLAAKGGASPAERYVLLVKGAEIAAGAGDLNLSLQGVDTLDADYEIDALEARQKLLDKFVNAGKAEQVDAAIPIAEQLMDQAVAADRFALSIEFSMTASHAATKSKTPTRKEIDDRLSRRRHEIHLLEPLLAAAKTAQETLAKNPADADANSIVGRWLCFYKNDWSAGLPLLAKGSDEKLKSLAEQELNAPSDAEQQAHLADAWWDLAAKEAGIARDSIHLHAGEIYQAASPNLTSALRKAAIEKRLAEIADVKPLSAAASSNASAGIVKFSLGRWVDILRLVDTSRDRVNGNWIRKGTDLSIHAGDEYGRIAIPVDIDGGYDLEVDFTRTSGHNDVAAMVSIGSHAAMIMLSGQGGAVSGLMNVRGHDPFDPQNPITTKPGSLENDHRYRLYVKARMLRDNRASIDVALDGKIYLPHWEGDPSELSYHPVWALPNPRRLGLGAYRGDVTFHSMRLRMVSGQASLDSAVADSSAPETAAMNASGSSTGISKSPAGQGFDLLAKVDTQRDTTAGSWERQGRTISSGDHVSKLVFPTKINESSYELQVELARTDSDDSIVICFPVGDTGCSFVLSNYRSAWSGLELVDGGRASQGNPTARSPSKLENGRRYVVRIVVKVQHDDAEINCFLDNDQLVAWKGKVDSLSYFHMWSIPPHRIGVAEHYAPVTIYSAKLVK